MARMRNKCMMKRKKSFLNIYRWIKDTHVDALWKVFAKNLMLDNFFNITRELQIINGPCWGKKWDSHPPERFFCDLSYNSMIDNTSRYSEKKRDRPSLIILSRRQSSCRDMRWSKELSGSGKRIRYEVIPLTCRTCARVQIYSIFDTPKTSSRANSAQSAERKGDSDSYCSAWKEDLCP